MTKFENIYYADIDSLEKSLKRFRIEIQEANKIEAERCNKLTK